MEPLQTRVPSRIPRPTGGRQFGRSVPTGCGGLPTVLRIYYLHDNGSFTPKRRQSAGASRRQTAKGSAGCRAYYHLGVRRATASPLAPCRRFASGSDWSPATDERRIVVGVLPIRRKVWRRWKSENRYSINPDDAIWELARARICSGRCIRRAVQTA